MANLITLNDYKDYAGIASSDFDSKLKTLISFTSDFIKKYCGRSFIDNYSNGAFTDIVEYWSGQGVTYTPHEYPLQAVTSVELSEDYGTSYVTLTAGTDFVWDKAKDNIYFIGKNEDWEMVNAYKITYRGGYSATPESLKLAALDLVDYYYKQKADTKKSAASVSIEYITSADLPPHIKRVLDLYRVI